MSPGPSGPRFIIIGDGSPAQFAVRYLAEAGASITSVFTTSKESRSLVAMLKREGLPWFESEILRDVARIPPSALDGDWLINAFSPVILRQEILERFPHRALNLHNGPLPQYAGINVTQWAIRNGETDFACTVHEMTADIDGGPIVADQAFTIGSEDSGIEVFRKSMKIGADLLVSVLGRILGDVPLESRPQDGGARRLYLMKEATNSALDWTLEAEQVRNFIRAADYRPVRSPTYQALWRTAGGQTIQLSKAEVAAAKQAPPGQVLALDQRGPTVACGKDSVILTAAYHDGAKLELDSWPVLLGK
jgi:methionyl-tRNA formyltransferase